MHEKQQKYPHTPFLMQLKLKSNTPKTQETYLQCEYSLIFCDGKPTRQSIQNIPSVELVAVCQQYSFANPVQFPQ